MKLLADIEGRERVVDLGRPPGAAFLIDGQPVPADVIEIEDGVYSVLWDGQVYEVRVADSGEVLSVDIRSPSSGGARYQVRVEDPRRLRRRSTMEWEGRQRIAAPMPGKVVRLLVRPGQRVEAGQGLAVVEAMKMQNEIRSPKSGTVERVLAKEGQPVNAGEVLCVVA